MVLIRRLDPLKLIQSRCGFQYKARNFKGIWGEEEEGILLKRIQLDLATVQQKMLANFVSKRSRNLIATLIMPDGFLVEDPKSWNGREDYQVAEAIIKTQFVTNDHIERRVVLTQDNTEMKSNSTMLSKSFNKTGHCFQMQRNSCYYEQVIMQYS